MQWLQRLADGWSLHRPWPADSKAPKVGNLKPVSENLRLDADLAAQHSTKANHGSAGNVIRRALHPFRNIHDPRRDRVRQDRGVEFMDGQ